VGQAPADDRPIERTPGLGSDDAGMFLWATQRLDEHRRLIVAATRFESTPDPGDEADLTATIGDQLEPLDHKDDSNESNRPGGHSGGQLVLHCDPLATVRFSL
jgi:hypothetical protein